MKIASAILAAGFAAVVGSAASAAVVEFDSADFVDQEGNPYDVFDATLTDIAGGVTFSALLDPMTIVSGDVYLIGFEGATFALGAITNVNTNTGDAVTAVCNGVTACNGGNGFTGGVFNTFTFDTIVQIGSSGSSSGLNTAISFDIAGVSAADIDILGFRLQTVTGAGVDADGKPITSLKILNDDPQVIPLPAAGFLLLGGLGGLAMLRKKIAA